MAAEKSILKVAKELNVGIAAIVDFLANEGIIIESRPNTRINHDIYTRLLREFSEKLVGKIDLNNPRRRLRPPPSTSLKSSELKSELRNKDIWEKYVTAQSKILEHKSKPIGIDTSKPIELNGLTLKMSIDQDIFKRVFKNNVEQIFNVEDFNFKSGYIQTSLENVANITKDKLAGLKELADISYISFNENPFIEGTITPKSSSAITELKKVIVSGVKPSVSFLISCFYKEIEISQIGNKINVVGELDKDIFRLFQRNLKLRKHGNRLVFTFQSPAALKQKVEELSDTGIEFPKPLGACLSFDFDYRFYKAHESSLNAEVYRLSRSLTKYFPENAFETAYSTYYTFDFEKAGEGINKFSRHEDFFWNNLCSKVHNENFQISRTNRTISFEYKTEEELNRKLKCLETLSYLDTYDRGGNYRQKFKIKFVTGLHEVQSILKKEFPSLNTELIANGQKLIFRHFYETGNKIEVLARVHNRLDDIIDSESFIYMINDTFQEKYLCEENFELKIEQEGEKLSKLVGEEFFFGATREKFILGVLKKVDYPDIYLVVDEDRHEELKVIIEKELVNFIHPDLKGERDKIKRLEDTALKLDNESAKLPNNNAKVFLFDSSKAKRIKNIDSLLNESSEEWQEFELNLFTKSLNESQRRAVFKSLHAEELALIQGPPGTGKSTAIAEIIWQHLRNNQHQKLLLTSEANLAVDNAIDRLKNTESNIVKPIRFGNVKNLESEGYFYSLEAIDSWQKSDASQDNTVSHWISNIVNRVSNQESEQICLALGKWKIHLQNPSNETKSLFAGKYIENVNLIGATGSSIGKLSSENKWTSFFHSYLNVFERQKYKKSSVDKTAKQHCYSVDISFDTVIMDEASKATPLELALPVLFGKKSIIVGDHRQLPPMIDGEEIKDVLFSIGEKQLANTLSHKEFETSQFERLFLKIDKSIKGTFDTQYRMHPSINEAIAQFYKDDGGLSCGLPLEEAYHDSFDKWDSRYHGLTFKNFITPQTHTVWVDVSTPEIKEGTSRVNFGEINAIDNILTALKNCDGKIEYDEWLSSQSIEEKEIGLISFYGKQINYINEMLRKNHSDIPVRLSTVDRFQGMERDIIIVSMVRSNKLASSKEQPANEIYGALGFPSQESLGFAESPNRLNVALSRARRLLIVVGNSEHFRRKETYRNVYNSIQQNGRVISAEELKGLVEDNGQH